MSVGFAFAADILRASLLGVFALCESLQLEEG
jgi:hypothetical protein